MSDGAALIRSTHCVLRSVGRVKRLRRHPAMPDEVKKVMALNIFSAPFLFTRGKEIPTQTFSFSVRMRPEQDDRA
ncbi:hypothetical protein [Salmonella bongori]|uniref:hypothetical protein n=1 Tax=Salmonella bongori TaxID=54736 RepID=UPI00112F7D5C|nr:hypothetical protein [Salmonella bongori]MBA3224371.1 hypothetical protein [Salmonella bongori]HDJ2740664.1 hypothetical protein [Salmonella bongori]